MNQSEIETLVECFLEERERSPDLTPERFVERVAGRNADLRAAIERALDMERLLGAARDDSEALPERIGPYAVQRILGRGGMGVVYEVEREGRRFALKLLPHAAALGPAAIERFRREARALARIRSPNIVTIHDSGSSDGSLWLVMEKVDGETLAAARKPFEPKRAARIIRDLARAVDAIHSAGLVHRDIKPQNVFLRPDDTPVLLDFGLVGAEGESTLTASAAVLGTPRYMAPEQARGEPALPRTDVHALGLVLYELCLGTALRPEATRADLIGHIARGPLRISRRLTRGLPRDVERILRAALAWNSARRLSSAGELADDLERFLRGEPVHATPPGLFACSADAIRRSPGWTAAGFAALASVAILFVAWPRGPDAAARERARTHLDAALCAIAAGDRSWAIPELERALREVPGEPMLAELNEWLRGDPSGAAERALASAPEHVVWSELWRARALRQQGQVEEALQLLRAGRTRSQGWAANAAEEAESLAGSGSSEQAAAAFARAIELRPGCGPLHAARARVLLRSGAIENGVGEALAALDAYREQRRDFALELPRLLTTATDTARVRAALERALDARPADAPLWFSLAYLYDSEHMLTEARRAYESALAANPDDLRTLLNVAHLYAGAQLGACEQCNEAYARELDLPDHDRALAALQRAVDVDRGRSEFAMGRVMQTALDLKARFDSPRGVRELVAALEAHVPSATGTARLRLSEAIQRLRGAVGER